MKDALSHAGNDLETLRYPIGRFLLDPEPTPEKRAAWIDAIRELPERMRAAVADLTAAQLEVPYRDGGWTLRQLVHHVADSHVNAYVRLKRALTETSPPVPPYDEKLWAKLPDSRLPVEVSLSLLESLHARWAELLLSMKDDTFGRIWLHPEHGPRDLDFLVQLYAWHGRHHVAHARALRTRMGWL